jgi:hypothetical protein
MSFSACGMRTWGLPERSVIVHMHVCAVCEQQSDDVRATMVNCTFHGMRMICIHVQSRGTLQVQCTLTLPELIPPPSPSTHPQPP